MAAQLFSLGENGEITYNEPIVEDGSLFNSGDSGVSVKDQIEVIENSVSSGDVVQPPLDVPLSSGGDIITYNVYAVPSDATGYPNANSLSYLEDVVKGYPLDYDYVAFRTDSSYAQSMILYVGPNASGSGSNIHFDKCDIIELTYHYESYNNSWLQRSYLQDSDVDISLSSNTLAYSNILPGYATFDNTMEDTKTGVFLAGALILAAGTFIISRILGGTKNV